MATPEPRPGPTQQMETWQPDLRPRLVPDLGEVGASRDGLILGLSWACASREFGQRQGPLASGRTTVMERGADAGHGMPAGPWLGLAAVDAVVAIGVGRNGLRLCR